MNARPPVVPRPAERMVFFTDAVVAIAMTLLILPLMESVGEASGMSAGAWIVEHQFQLMSFAISFLLIASFWRGHHALYEHVEKYTPRLMTLNFAWMFTIVWIPVATAISTGLSISRGTIALYVGSLIATCVVSAAVQRHVQRHPELVRADYPVTEHGLAVNIAMGVLLTVALVIAVVLPAVNYLAMFVLTLMRPTVRLVSRRLSPTAEPAGTDRDR